jgi:predicted nucleotidyltransferase
VTTQPRDSEVEAFLQRADAWARGRSDVRALALAGSWARRAARPDSDVDLVVVTDAPDRYVASDDWIGALGAELVATEEWGAVTSRRLRLPSGLEVEVGFARPSWAATDPVDPGTRRVVTAGLRAIHDPDGLLVALTAACAQAASFSSSPVRSSSQSSV